jgi:RimJ/RimL family protein N-acetyltransferase
MRPDDGAAVAAYRNDPAIAEFQDWPMPYTEAMYAERFAAAAARQFDLVGGVNLAIEAHGVLVGDLYVRLDDGLADIGWTLSLPAQGRGYATEAASAVVDMLFGQLGAHRLHASMHPDNVASARVCEALGMTFESLTRLTYKGPDGWEDDAHYSMVRAEWEAWRVRPRSRPADVRLVELGPENVARYSRLATHQSQRRFVAPMAGSFEDALFPEWVDGAPVVPWMRGIEADGEAAGFVMLADVTEHHPDPFLWRLLIDRRHQRRGIGERVVQLVSQRAQAMGCATLFTSYVAGVPGSPEPFYRRLGFRPTGDIDDGETVAALTLGEAR